LTKYPCFSKLYLIGDFISFSNFFKYIINFNIFNESWLITFAFSIIFFISSDNLLTKQIFPKFFFCLLLSLFSILQIYLFKSLLYLSIKLEKELSIKSPKIL
jgi:hypothetical protein